MLKCCCRHSNTFFTPTASGDCKGELLEVSLTYDQGGGETGTIKRVMCVGGAGGVDVVIGESCIMLKSKAGSSELVVGHRDLNTTMDVMRRVISAEVGACEKDVIRKSMPCAKNICGKVPVVGCRVHPSVADAGIVGDEKTGIGKGREISTVSCKAISTFSGGTEFINIVASKDITDSVRMLSKVCSIDTKAVVCVYMAIFSASLPHKLSLGSNGAPLVFALGKKGIPAKRLYNINERDNCMVDIQFEDWEELAEYLTRSMGEGRSAGGEFLKLIGKMDRVSKGVLMGTKLKAKVTHKGNVILSFSWSNHVSMGNIPWTTRNTNVVGAMMMMALQAVEMWS